MVMSQQHHHWLGGRAISGRIGAVSAGHPQAVAAGLEVLQAGGNAVDAAVAAGFAACVVEPNNAGLAGYGHFSAYLAADDRFLTVDHNPRAPRRATAEIFTLEPSTPEGHDWPGVVDDANATGALAPAVPGAVRGLWEAHRAGGRLPWDRVLEPAIRAADAGVEVSWALLLEIVAREAEIRASPAAAALLLGPGGTLPRPATADAPGDRLDQRPLAAILRRIAAEGPDAFHRGDVAQAIAQTVAAGGGILDAEDIAAYTALVLDEPPLTFAGARLVTSNDTVGAEALNILEQLPLDGVRPGSADWLHLLTEAMGVAFADNATHYGDPEHVASPVDGLASPAFAAQRAAEIRFDAALPRPIAAGDPWPHDGRARPDGGAPPRSAGGMRGTSQIAVADADGNVAALITTIGNDFGCLVVVPDTGLILNSSMANFDPRPGRSNSIAPGKMPFFAVPAVVAARDGRGVFAAAGSGGYPILTSVVGTTAGVLAAGLPVQEAIDIPRTHTQGHRTHVDARVPPADRDELARRGHELVVQETHPGALPFSRVSAVTAAADGTLTAGSGPAWNTAAGAC
jgi:gamma-glutamyltranspeptidase/glutathione hydrolase